MANFLAELKRRHVFRVGAAYAVVAWVITQVIDILSQVFDLPSWIAQPAVVLLAIGFPIALVVAWTVESKPHRAVAAAVRSKPTIVDWTLCGALVVVIGLVSYQQLALEPGGRTVETQQGVAAARAASATQSGAISIAVLPFTNLSSDPEQEFFSDGMTQEITAALAKIADLRLVGRTSAFQFKGEKQDLRTIGRALTATHLLEGSVRKEGDRVRITAQLVQAENGVNMWTESYDRQLTGVFAIQEDIAQSIAGALRMPLGLAQGERLITNRSIDAESYSQYLHAKALVRARAAGVREALKILVPLTERNPDYAPAWALLAVAYSVERNTHRNAPPDELRRVVEASLPKEEAAARRAIQLDPTSPEGYLALTITHGQHRQLLMVEDQYSKALALDANNPDSLNGYRNFLLGAGRLKEALAIGQQLRAVEPFVPLYNANLAEAQWLNGQNDAAIAMLRDFSVGDANRAGDLARIYASMGRYRDAADVLEEIPSRTTPPEIVAAAVRALRTAPTSSPSPQSLPRLAVLGFVYLHVGADSRALEYYEGAAEAGFFSGPDIGLLFHPSFAAVRKTDRFKAFMRQAGYVDYWHARGWPDMCRPVGTDDFACA